MITKKCVDVCSGERPTSPEQWLHQLTGIQQYNVWQRQTSVEPMNTEHHSFADRATGGTKTASVGIGLIELLGFHTAHDEPYTCSHDSTIQLLIISFCNWGSQNFEEWLTSQSARQRRPYLLELVGCQHSSHKRATLANLRIGDMLLIEI